jgi:DNA-binding MarR family transcriptional regulator
MIDNKDILFKPSESMRDLQFLEELEKTPHLSQRELSSRFGIALGVTNACLKRMLRRGLIRLQKVPPRRIGYYLTPMGFAEKARLTMKFISYNIHHYSSLKALITEKFLEMESQGVKRLIFWGVSDEMEIAYVILQGTDMELVAIIGSDDGLRPQTVLGRKAENPVIIENLRADAILITSILANNEILRNAKRIMRRNSTIKLFTIT